MVSRIYSIKRVSEVTEGTEDTIVSFTDGTSAVLRKAEPGSEWMVAYLRACCERRSLVGVSLHVGTQITDVGAADRNLVLAVQDKGSYVEEVDIWFGGMDGPMSLLKSHPNFRDLFEDLAAAVANKQQIWYITSGGCVLDVLLPSPENEAVLCRS